MKLNVEQIRAITVGATRVEEIDGAIHISNVKKVS